MRRITENVQHQVYVAGVEDTRGNATDTWATATTVGIYAFDPGTTAEFIAGGRDAVTTNPTLYLPDGVVFGHRDKVTARGLTYEVDGKTREWKSDHFRGGVVTLKRVEG